MNKTLRLILTLLVAMLGAAGSWAQSETTIPTYTTVSTTPEDGATVSAITSVSISLSSEDYDAPLGIMPGAAAVTAVKLVGETEEPLTGLKSAVKDTKLIVSFDKPFTEAATVVINIPQGITNNLAMPVANMTTQEIIAEGGCTNPAITLTLHVVPSVLPVKDVTGVGYDTKYLQDEDGNFIKDEKGQYIRVDKYDSLIDAQLEPAKEDRVSVMYFWYDEQFASIDYKGGASVTNVTTGVPFDIADVSFKTGGDSHRNDVIELRLSSADYIYSKDYHQGVYEVTLPEGIATTANGLKNGGFTFRFTFGDPEQAYVPKVLNLDAYLGDYKAVSEEGEQVSQETFSFKKDTSKGVPTYFIEGLCGSKLSIPVEAKDDNFFLKFTEEGVEAFMSLRGGDVQVFFTENEGEPYIFIDEYALYQDDDVVMGGAIYFKRVRAVIDALSAPVSEGYETAVYDLQGRHSSANGMNRGVYVSNGRKVLK